MESERRNDDEDSYADMEASAAADAGSYTGGSECSEQADRLESDLSRMFLSHDVQCFSLT